MVRWGAGDVKFAAHLGDSDATRGRGGQSQAGGDRGGGVCDELPIKVAAEHDDQRRVQAGRVAIEAGLRVRQRPRPGPLSAPACSTGTCAVSLGPASGELVAREIAVFITGRALITVRKGCRAQVMLTAGPGLRWR